MAVDLFTWLDALWNKTKPTGAPPIYIMHRFLASDQAMANAARYLQSDLRREPSMVFSVWQGLLPKGRGAPRLSYVAAKKPKAAEELTARMMRVLGERREVVEEMQDLLTQAGLAEDLYIYFGMEPPEEVLSKPEAPVVRSGGLFA